MDGWGALGRVRLMLEWRNTKIVQTAISNLGSDDKVQGMAIGLGVLGGVLVVIGVAVILKCISAKVLKSRKVGSAPAYAVKTSDGSAASQANETPPPAYVINAFDGPAAFQLDEMTKARELEL